MQSMFDAEKQRKAQIPLGINPKSKKAIEVVIAGDSKIERMLLKRLLLQDSFDVVGEGEDGLQTINLFKFPPKKPQILFLDYEIPRNKGAEVIQELKMLAPDTIIIVIANNTRPEFINKLHQLQIRQMIVKPILKEKLREKLAKALGRDDVVPKTIVEKTDTRINLSKLEIPSLPTVINKILQFNVNFVENGTVALEQLISPDKGICSTIIRIANSAFYGRQGKIETIHDALTLMGVKNVRNIVIFQHFRNVQKTLQGKLFVYYLLELPVLTALIAFDIATPLNRKQFREEVFLHALLYRIGMMVFGMNFSARYTDVLKAYQTGIKSIYEFEQEEFGISSIELGTKVFEVWKLPVHFLNTVRQQKFALDSLSSVSDTDRIIRLADILAREMSGHLVSSNDEDLLQEIFKYYGTDDELKALFAEEYYEMIQEHPFYELIRGE